MGNIGKYPRREQVGFFKVRRARKEGVEVRFAEGHLNPERKMSNTYGLSEHGPTATSVSSFTTHRH